MVRRAFTLLESVMVLGLVAILYLAVSVNFSGAAAQGATNQAQTNAQNALTAAVDWASAHANVPPAVADLSTVTSDIHFVTASSTSSLDTTASVGVAIGTTACPVYCVAVAVAAATASSTTPFTCWYAVHNAATPAGEFSEVYAYSTAPTLGNCTGTKALTLASLASTSATGGTPSAPYNANFG